MAYGQQHRSALEGSWCVLGARDLRNGLSLLGVAQLGSCFPCSSHGNNNSEALHTPQMADPIGTGPAQAGVGVPQGLGLEGTELQVNWHAPTFQCTPLLASPGPTGITGCCQALSSGRRLSTTPWWGQSPVYSHQPKKIVSSLSMKNVLCFVNVAAEAPHPRPDPWAG